MKRISKIFGFSLPPETFATIDKAIKVSHKTKSEYMRGVIDYYLKSTKNSTSASNDINLTPEDTNKILKLYYQLIGSNPKEIIVIGLGIISRDGEVLIGCRLTQPDQWVKELTWVFPGGKFTSLDFTKEIQTKVKEETNLDVHVGQLIHARLIPDSPEKKVKIIALYFNCSPVSGNTKPGGDLKQLKWVPAMKIFHYFTTSTADEIVNFLGTV